MMILSYLNNIKLRIANLVKPPQYIPEEIKNNFVHFYYDYAWFGVLNGTLIAFLSVYMARIGSTGVEIGLISALPALINLVFALPAGVWFEKRPIQKGVFISALSSRIFYVLLIFIPFISSNFVEIRLIILVTMLMSIPATALAIGGNAIFAEAVPLKWRGHVAGVRSAFFALTTMVSTLIGGVILEVIPFPVGYQIVFLIGSVGAMVSTYHLGKIKPVSKQKVIIQQTGEYLEESKPPTLRMSGNLHARLKRMFNSLNINILRGKFGKTLVLLLTFHLFQSLAIPVMTFFMVNRLYLSDQVISIGNVAFYLTMLIISTQIPRLTTTLGSNKVIGLGIIILSTYPAGLIFSRFELVFYLISATGGVGWGLAWGSLFNYLLERVPDENKPPYLAWYNIALSMAILLGSIVGPIIADKIGIEIALGIFALGRVLAGWLIYKDRID